MANHICPICESGQLHARSEWIDVEHMGKHGHIKSHFLACDGCGSEQAGTKEARDNKRAMIAFKKQAQGLLTGAEVLALRKHWQLSQQDAARIFGGGPVAFSKYESDDVMQSDAMDKLLRVADQVPAALEKLKADAGVTNRETRLWKTTSIVGLRSLPRKVNTKVIQSHEIEREVCYG